MCIYKTFIENYGKIFVINPNPTLLNDNNKHEVALPNMSDRFKSLVAVLYKVSVCLIILATFISLFAGNDYLTSSGDILFRMLVGGLLLIANEISFGLIATIVKIRDNTSKN